MVTTEPPLMKDQSVVPLSRPGLRTRLSRPAGSVTVISRMSLAVLQLSSVTANQTWCVPIGKAFEKLLLVLVVRPLSTHA